MASVAVDPRHAAPCAAKTGPSRSYEQELWNQGYAHVAGVDEAGRGPLAGPVVAAACIIPPRVTIPGVDDSKTLNEAQREAAYDALTQHPDVIWAICMVSVEDIDALNILQATMVAMARAARALSRVPDFVLVDGNRTPQDLAPLPSRCIVRGDSKCYAIAAASIIAKVTRDRLMVAYDAQHPGYNFAQHKGYGVPAHVQAIRTLGPCAIHRRSFAPVRTWFPRDERDDAT